MKTHEIIPTKLEKIVIQHLMNVNSTIETNMPLKTQLDQHLRLVFGIKKYMYNLNLKKTLATHSKAYSH